MAQAPAATFQHLLEDPGRFVVAVELETSRGLALEGKAQRVFGYAEQLRQSGTADVFTLTDNPGGHPHLKPETLGRALLQSGSESIVNVSCKDYNRNGLESRLWSLASAGFRNILALSGDYPSQGIGGLARPVFDVDSAGLLEMVRQMDRGLPEHSEKAMPLRGPPFFAGAAVNPFKLREGELMTQLFKLELKARLGTRFFITQIGYDSRKLDELRRYMALKGINVPLIGTVFTLGVNSARAFNKWAIPGVVLTDALLAIVERQAASADKGRAFFIEFAAKQVAVLRGLGYRGVHFSGRADAARLQRVIETERTFAPGDWKEFAREIQFPQPEEFYYFEQDSATGLASDQVNRKYLESKGKRGGFQRKLTVSPAFHLGRLAHAVALAPAAPAAGPARTAYRALEKWMPAARVAHTIERVAKLPLYGCKDCGDCSLPELAYLCPESQCAKNQRNGPCGGTKAGKCEVIDKDCIWLRAYDRLKLYGQEERMLDSAPVMCDASLRGTSSWANALLGRDHTAHKDTKAALPEAKG